MAAELVQRTPQEWVLRHGHDQTAPRPGRAIQFANRMLVVVQVLDDIENTDQVELAVIGKMVDVYLCQRDVGDFLPRERESGQQGVGAGILDRRNRRAQFPQDAASPTTDVDERSRSGKVPPDGPGDQTISMPEPEVSLI